MTEKALIIHIPRWHPVTLNRLMNSHPMSRSRLKLADLQMIGAYAVKAKVPKATGRRRLEIVITLGKGQRAPDPDAYFKVTNDALVRLGFLRDDSRTWLDLMPVRYERAIEKATTLILTEIL